MTERSTLVSIRKLAQFAMDELDPSCTMKEVLKRIHDQTLITQGKGAWNKINWTSDQIQFLKSNHGALTNKELAEELGLRITAVRMKLYELGLKRMELEYFTEEQTKFLIDHYQTMGDVEMAEFFNQVYYKEKGWTHKHIEKKRKYLKLQRTSEQQLAIKERNRIQGRFSASHWRRWFNKETPIGEVRIWRYQNGKPFQVIKQEDGFVHHAPWLWELENGPVPEGHVVKFKDNNNLNVVIENLYLSTRIDHIKGIHDTPGYLAYLIAGKDQELKREVMKHDEIIELKRTHRALDKEIKNQTSKIEKNDKTNIKKQA